MNSILADMQKKHSYLVCIDSDGCMFDNMELKHKECFCPATVNIWELQGVSRYAREAAEYVNLYSRTRGINRFPGLIRTLELTYARKEVKERGYSGPDLAPLKKWTEQAPVLSAAALQEYCKSHNTEQIFAQAMSWSQEADVNIKRIVRNVPPFPYAKETLQLLSEFADIVIVSAASHEAIVREWSEHDLIEYVTVIAGQEIGTKAQCIKSAVASGHYASNQVMMIGDAPGDHIAAKENGVQYYPIIPGHETKSWKRMRDEYMKHFLNGNYYGECMDSLLAEFYSVLLEMPPWKAEK